MSAGAKDEALETGPKLSVRATTGFSMCPAEALRGFILEVRQLDWIAGVGTGESLGTFGAAQGVSAEKVTEDALGRLQNSLRGCYEM